MPCKSGTTLKSRSGRTCSEIRLCNLSSHKSYCTSSDYPNYLELAHTEAMWKAGVGGRKGRVSSSAHLNQSDSPTSLLVVAKELLLVQKVAEWETCVRVLCKQHPLTSPGRCSGVRILVTQRVAHIYCILFSPLNLICLNSMWFSSFQSVRGRIDVHWHWHGRCRRVRVPGELKSSATACSLPSLVTASDLHWGIKWVQGFVTRCTNFRRKLQLRKKLYRSTKQAGKCKTGKWHAKINQFSWSSTTGPCVAMMN